MKENNSCFGWVDDRVEDVVWKWENRDRRWCQTVCCGGRQKDSVDSIFGSRQSNGCLRWFRMLQNLLEASVRSIKLIGEWRMSIGGERREMPWATASMCWCWFVLLKNSGLYLQRHYCEEIVSCALGRTDVPLWVNATNMEFYRYRGRIWVIGLALGQLILIRTSWILWMDEFK